MLRFLLPFIVLLSMQCYGSTYDFTADFSKVIGKDDRRQVSNTTLIPYRTMGLLVFRKGTGWYKCTGTLIGPKHVLTAGHCVLSDGKWATNISFIPGKNGPREPYGRFAGVQALTNPTYSKGRDIKYDYGMVILREPIGERLGYMEFEIYNRAEASLNIAGYSGDKPYGTLWRAFCPVIREYEKLLSHTCDAYSGSSGSAAYLYHRDTGRRVIVGIHAGSYGANNRATKIDEEMFNQLHDWMEGSWSDE